MFFVYCSLGSTLFAWGQVPVAKSAQQGRVCLTAVRTIE